MGFHHSQEEYWRANMWFGINLCDTKELFYDVCVRSADIIIEGEIVITGSRNEPEKNLNPFQGAIGVCL